MRIVSKTGSYRLINVKLNNVNVSDQEKIKREPQLFLPVRPDTLFAPYDIHKQGLQTNRCSVSHFKDIHTKIDSILSKEEQLIEITQDYCKLLNTVNCNILFSNPCFSNAKPCPSYF